VSTVINKFDNEYAFLSNFFCSMFSWKGEDWRTVEHAFQGAKTSDPVDKTRIRIADSPGYAKKLGRKVDLRSDWEDVKIEIMAELVCAKFDQHPELMKRLRATGDAELVKGNYWHDNFWGDCTCKKCKSIEGENVLGQILMIVRKGKDNHGL
jgi:ribA/ribD-fused uncharacterized protein